MHPKKAGNGPFELEHEVSFFKYVLPIALLETGVSFKQTVELDC